MEAAATDHRRAVALRNVEAILDAAERLLLRSADPSISAVAQEAGLSRPTVYAHFSDRDRLLAGVVERAVGRWVAASEGVEPRRGAADEALVRLIELGWEQISRSSHIAAAAAALLDPEAVRGAHDRGRDVVRRLARRGRREGTFRDDVPVDWLVSSFFALMHAAHAEVAAGRMSSRAAARALTSTVPDLFRGRA